MLALYKQMFYYINTNKCSCAYLGVVEYMIIKDNLSIMEKLEILSDAAKYDVSCSSSGVERNNNKKVLGIPGHVAYAIVSVQMEGVYHY